jgi:hypothetical protein
VEFAIEDAMKIGFTGTQRGMTAHQKARLVTILTALWPEADELKWEFHHGDCVGADFEAATIAKQLGFWIVGWPPEIATKRAYFKSDETHDPAPYLERNRFIVNATERLIAAPKENEEVLRSGTWATIRHARKMSRPIDIVWPRLERL